MNISRRDFLKGSAATLVSFAALNTLSGCAEESVSEETTKEPTYPTSPVDGKYVTKALGHESWVYVSTTFKEGAITECFVISHNETIGIGNYACARIPAAIVANQSVNVPNVKGSSITSMAIKNAVREAIKQAGYKEEDFAKEIVKEATNQVIEKSCDVVVMGGGTAGLICAARLAEKGAHVIVVEKQDIPGGSSSMTMGGMSTCGSRRQRNFDINHTLDGTYQGNLDAMMAYQGSMVNPENVTTDGSMPFVKGMYEVSGDIADWLSDIGVGFNTLGTFEGATTMGATLTTAPGMYMGGSGYQMMFLANRIASYANSEIIYSTKVTELLKDSDGSIIGVKAISDTNDTYTITAKKVMLATGGFAKNAEMVKQYYPEYADEFFNCGSGSTGEGIQMALDAGSVMQVQGRHLPAYLASAQLVELAFFGTTTPGVFVNVDGSDLGSAVSHYSCANAKLDKNNKNTFYYFFDEAAYYSGQHYMNFGFDTYKAVFERGEVIHYNSVEEASETLHLPNLKASIDEINRKHEAGEVVGYSVPKAIETRNGIYGIKVIPNFYLTTTGIKIDPNCHVLKEDGSMIANLYAAGDVCGSMEERDGVNYGYGYYAALTYGYRAAETISKEL